MDNHMLRVNNLSLPFDHTQLDLEQAVLEYLGLDRQQLVSMEILRSSLDSRKGRPIRRVYSLRVEVRREQDLRSLIAKSPDVSIYQPHPYQPPALIARERIERPLVVGSGPAGLFAALVLAEAGLEPLVLERGRDVKQRTADVQRFWSAGELDCESNVQFGEGGAGTFSDGKLGSRIKDRSGRREKVLRELVEAGAPGQILADSKPHVGTANLVQIVRNIRAKITDLGGEVRFQSRVSDLVVDQGCIWGVELADGSRIPSAAVILAVGHSARDTFEMLQARGVELAPKPFSVGFRIEHPQRMVDLNQYGSQAGHPALEPADYQLSFHASGGRTVYSFCMCPGGYVIGAASEKHGVVTNGMSEFERDGMNANSALVVEIYPADFSGKALGGIALQRQWEAAAYRLGGGDYHAPVQLVGDFLAGKPSTEMGKVAASYRPGVRPGNLRSLYPAFVSEALEEAFPHFDRRIRGFSRDDALLTGAETRTSCPLRILRGKDFQSVSFRGLYPAGEGSGYAGGIMSSAIDGMKAAEQLILSANGHTN